MAISPAISDSVMSSWSRGDAARDDPVDENDERGDEEGRGDHADDDDVQRIQLAGVALEVARLAHAEERPADGANGAQERSLAAHRLLQAGLVGVAHEGVAPGRRAAATGSAGTLPPTSKKVYDKVIVFTSFGSRASTTKTTGHCLASPACSRCSRKQKHSSLVKCAIATFGA